MMDMFNIGSNRMAFVKSESIRNQFYSDLVTPIENGISVQGTTVHIFYAVKMGKKYLDRYNSHFKNPDIRCRNMQHEELLVCHPERWAEEVKKCCGLLSEEEGEKNMGRYEEIQNAYKNLGGEATFYDGMITCSTLPGKAVCKLVWNMDKRKNDHYLKLALSGIPQNFDGKMLEVPVGTEVKTVEGMAAFRCRKNEESKKRKGE